MKYQIRYEKRGGKYCYVIYRKTWIRWSFFERWNNSKGVGERMKELV